MNYAAAKKFILNKLREELPTELYYHSVEHTLDVLAVTESLCAKENISAYATELLKTAALFHDAGFTISHLEHEKLGCEIVRKYLPTFGYTPNEIGQICRMIMATKIPQSPQNALEQILSDADLDYLGRSDFYVIGQRLYQELKNRNSDFSIASWDAIQVSFLESHSFFTTTNIATRAPQKAIYLNELKEKYAFLEKS
ncbi:MAG: HD domain-containing protein [Saprospiraceae bacterium]